MINDDFDSQRISKISFPYITNVCTKRRNRKISSLILRLVPICASSSCERISRFENCGHSDFQTPLAAQHSLECVIRTGLFAVLNNGIEFISPNGVVLYSHLILSFIVQLLAGKLRQCGQSSKTNICVR